MTVRRRLTTAMAALAVAVLLVPSVASMGSMAAAAPLVTRAQTDPSNNGQCQPCPIIDPNVNGPCGPQQCPLPPELRTPDAVAPAPNSLPAAANPPGAPVPGAPSPYAPSPVAPAAKAVAPGAVGVSTIAPRRVLGGRLVLAFAICLALSAVVITLAGSTLRRA